MPVYELFEGAKRYEDEPVTKVIGKTYGYFFEDWH